MPNSLERKLVFYSKEQVLNDFVENNSQDSKYNNDLIHQINIEEVSIELTPEEIKSFDGELLNNTFTQYIIIKDEEQFPYISHKFNQVLKEYFPLRVLVSLTHYSPNNENIIHIDRKRSGRNETVYTFTQIKNNSIVIYYWCLAYSDYKDKIRYL